MTGLAADVASLATGLGAVAGDMARLVAIIAALHRKAAGIVAALRAAARHVTSLVAIVTTQLRSLSEKTSCNCLIWLLRRSAVGYDNSDREDPSTGETTTPKNRCSSSRPNSK